MLVIEEIKGIVTKYFQDLPAKEVYLFGSYSRGDQTEQSDIDIMVWRDKESKQIPDFPKWQADLAKLFNRPVDLRLGTGDWKKSPTHKNKELIEQALKLLFSK
jgi:predicted nucleotidyltransferase